MAELTEYFGVNMEWIAHQVGELSKLRILHPDSFELINEFFKNLSNEEKAKIHIFSVHFLNEKQNLMQFKKWVV